MALTLILPGQGRSEKEYYMYGVLHVDNEAHTIDLVPLKELDNVPVFDNPQAYMEHMRVSLYDAVLFPPIMEGRETNPGSLQAVEGVDGSLTLKPVRSTAICDAWEENNCSTGLRRLTFVHNHTTL